MSGIDGRDDYPAAVVTAAGSAPPPGADSPSATGADAAAGAPPGAGEVPPDEVAPAVVVVMVAHDPGDWWEFALASIGEQSYPNVATFVVDTASETDLTTRLAAVLPEAHLRRLDDDPGYGPASNEAIEAIEGAAFFLLCHDDVVFDPLAIQALVEEAFRSNAGIVGPKLVDWDDPEHLLEVGMGVDKFGAPSPLVDRGELDQEQHDAVRDVFYISGGATLVRADLFATLGGFDPGIPLLGEDLDLCWRAQIAGARVIVAPAAKVAHREALDERRDASDRRQLAYRHRLRTVLTCYGRFHRLRVVPQAFLLALFEALFSVVFGRVRHAADVIGAWTANARQLGDIRARRKAVKAIRVVRDKEIRRLQVRGSARLSAFFRGQLGANDDRLAGMAGVGRDLAQSVRSPTARLSLAAWIGVLLLLLIGSRDLITQPIPTAGEFVAFRSGPIDLLREFVSGYHAAGVGSDAANPTSFAALGLSGLAFFGAMGQLRRVLVLALLPLGVLGMWRLARPIGSRRSRVVALVVYAVVPVAANSIGNGHWSGLVLYALSPWIVNQLARASKLAPFGAVGGAPGPGVVERPLLQRTIKLGMLTAIGTMFVPFTAPVVLGIAGAMAVGGLVVGQARGVVRLLVAGGGAVIVAVILNLPWSLTFLTRDWTAVANAQGVPPSALDLGQIMRFATGPVGDSALAWAFVGGAVLALLIGKRWRLAWAMRGWAIALAGWGVVFVSAEGWLPGSFPPVEVLLAPAAVGLALSAAMGMAAFEVDLPDYHFGWRQIASVLAGAAVVVSIMPTLGAATEGRWNLAGGDYSQFLDRLESPSEQFRSLWIGDARVMPGTTWRLGVPEIDDHLPARPLVFTTTTGRNPDVQQLWPGAGAQPGAPVREAIAWAASGQTDRLGALLAPMGVEFIVVPRRTAPPPFVTENQSDPVALLDLLGSQLDLARVEMPAGMVVYRNTAWGPLAARLERDVVIPEHGAGEDASLDDLTVPALAGAPDAVPSITGFANAAGNVPGPARVYVGAASSPRWVLTVNGVPQSRGDALGWANQYSVDVSGQAQLRYQTSKWRYLELAGVFIAWVLAVVYVWRTRVAKLGERDRASARRGLHP